MVLDADDVVIDSPIFPSLDGLPYHCLLNTFEFAAISLENDRPRKSPEEWLQQASLVCKRFTRPARAVMFGTMRLGDHYQARRLISYLKSLAPGSKPRVWIRYLTIEALPVLARKSHGDDPIDLIELLKLVPMLRGLHFQVIDDMPIRRSLARGSGARSGDVYQPSLISGLKEQRIYLHSVKWNYYFNRNNPFPWGQLADIHKEPVFGRLRHVEVVWFNGFASSKNRDIFTQSLVDALNSSPSLRSLTFNGCQFHSSLDVLGALPRNLQSLTIMDSAVSPVLLDQCLAMCGGNLRSLTLKHNRTANLLFLGALEINCPKLESLQYDLSSISDQDSAVSSAGPAFSKLLPHGITPTWPSSLQRVELLYLRRWGLEPAETFFNSFLQHSHKLPHLRALIIKTTVDLDWKARVEFRDKWTARLLKVFKRYSPNPEPICSNTEITSSSRRTTKASSTTLERKRSLVNTRSTSNRSSSHRAAEASVSSRTRKRSRITTENHIDSRRSSDRITRLRKEQETLLNYSPPSIDIRNGNENDATEDTEKYAIQGMCDVVDIRIENLHPAQVQYVENDFLDSEPSGDEDYLD